MCSLSIVHGPDLKSTTKNILTFLIELKTSVFRAQYKPDQYRYKKRCSATPYCSGETYITESAENASILILNAEEKKIIRELIQDRL